MIRTGRTVAFALVALFAGTSSLRAQAPWYWADRSDLELMVDLAAGLPEDPASARDSVLDRLALELEEVDREISMLESARMGRGLSAYRVATEPESGEVEALLWAFWEASARLRGAEAARDRDWVRTHLAATRTFAARASDALRAEADDHERQARTLEEFGFARRSGRAEAEAALARIRDAGLPDAQRRLFLEGGSNEEDLAAFESAVLATAADSLGTSIVELYEALAAVRRELAASLEAASSAGYPLAPSYRHAFTLGNPRDHPARMDVTILPASVPSGWRFTLVAEDTLDSTGAPLTIYEVRPGRQYRVDLPAGATARVATLVEPLTGAGEGTTARWAVEGRIGSELLGGIVQEMHVGEPPVALPESVPAPRGLDWRWPAAGIVGVVLLGLIGLLRRRRIRPA